MAQDEGRFGRVNIPRSAWAPMGIRPLAPRQIVRESFYVYSAICPELGKMTSLILPYSNTDMMNIFLEEVSKDFKDYLVIMQLDGAGWHKSSELKIPDNIKLVFQPPYSPELNPVEHLWDELREKFLHNRIFNTINDVIDAITTGLNKLESEPWKITSMTNFPHLRIE